MAFVALVMVLVVANGGGIPLKRQRAWRGRSKNG